MTSGESPGKLIIPYHTMMPYWQFSSKMCIHRRSIALLTSASFDYSYYTKYRPRHNCAQTPASVLKRYAASSIVSPLPAHLSSQYGRENRLATYQEFSTDTHVGAKTQKLLPLLIPSSIPLSVLLSSTVIDSFRSLPESRAVLDIIDGLLGTNNSNAQGEADRILKQAQTNVQRARDIFQSLPDLHAATYLLEASLQTHVGKHEMAIDSILRYQHSSHNMDPVSLQFMKAKLMFHAGKFNHALSEYEDMLEFMEGEVERQMKRKQQQNRKDGGDTLPVINGAAALTGVGLTKLMIHQISQHEYDNADNTTKREIIEAIQTATEMLLESRKDALVSAKHSSLALDLGLAAAISLTNFGVVHRLVSGKPNRAIKCWKQGLEVLDQMLHDSMNSATIIPKDKFQCMESLRARLYCNISCVLLHLDANLEVQDELPKIDEDTLKEASEMARKALGIYDGMLNSPTGTSNEKDVSADTDNSSVDYTEDSKEWDELLKENPNLLEEEENSDEVDQYDQAVSPLWLDYHRAESARALGFVASCYYHAGASVTAEGLFQSAIDASSSYPLGQCLKSDTDRIGLKGVSLSSPHLGLIARDVRLEYALLCDSWDKRKSDADKLRLGASKIEREGALTGFAGSMFVSGLFSSTWLFSPLDFER
ncbi:hypothetical protein HJC23_000378 [Cyclotella cryptica]|uniref:Uncharacterized protein n=1 Tax=Cyclotella cryptica TaxID=29204 RepID=A0ABD3P6D2_9STRA|eukprot:CCRYP_017018-RA/>CCRYP_017018-RA protein AED:0.08 eAED:0.06 QI:0/-1/0/1/-1/1/1/0/651